MCGAGCAVAGDAWRHHGAVPCAVPCAVRSGVAVGVGELLYRADYRARPSSTTHEGSPGPDAGDRCAGRRGSSREVRPKNRSVGRTRLFTLSSPHHTVRSVRATSRWCAAHTHVQAAVCLHSLSSIPAGRTDASTDRPCTATLRTAARVAPSALSRAPTYHPATRLGGSSTRSASAALTRDAESVSSHLTSSS